MKLLDLPQTFVVFDLETTGLDVTRETILEIGAVKFRGGEVLEELSQVINPRRRINAFITALTGITQAEADVAPELPEVVERVEHFLGDWPLIAHNLPFDRSFLQAHGIAHSTEAYDTFDLASVVLPRGPGYGLNALASRWGLTNESPHRALSDARATMGVFRHLVGELSALEPELLRSIRRIGNPDWALGRLITMILEFSAAETGTTAATNKGSKVLGHSPRAMKERTSPRWPSALPERVEPLTEHEQTLTTIPSIFAKGGTFSQVLPTHEARDQQVTMVERVVNALVNRRHLVLEAGTGIGKSLAYLIPAIAYSLLTNRRVVVSTNTINLQEQLVSKDVPLAIEIVQRYLNTDKPIQVAKLMGRGNYLCYRKFLNRSTTSRGSLNTPPSNDEARMLAKCLVWLQDTQTGNKGDLAINRWQDATIFNGISAEGMCDMHQMPCFYRKALREALGANLVLVNHALLAFDAKSSNSMLGNLGALIVDEAQHLHRAAIDANTESASAIAMERELTRVSLPTGPLRILSASLHGATNVELHDQLVKHTSRIAATTPLAQQATSEMFELLTASLHSGSELEVRITTGVRDSPVWPPLVDAWDKLKIQLEVLMTAFSWILNATTGIADLQDAWDEVSQMHGFFERSARILHLAITAPQEDDVYWASFRGRDTALYCASLDVSAHLHQTFFNDKDMPVMLTGATITDEGSFSRLCDELGIPEADVEVLDAPFDYRQKSITYVPRDIPSPGTPGYIEALGKAIAEVALGTEGRSLALFTSNSALRNTRGILTELLTSHGYKVIGQGMDGSPHRIMRMLADSERVVALGSGSMWEGVDVGSGVSLDALMVSRLPFGVPTDPLLSALAERHPNGFNDFMLPEAVRKFRQSFGRLIRSKTDRGVFVVLDNRVVTKSYGKVFMTSLPGCEKKMLPMAKLQSEVAKWLNSPERTEP